MSSSFEAESGEARHSLGALKACVFHRAQEVSCVAVGVHWSVAWTEGAEDGHYLRQVLAVVLNLAELVCFVWQKNKLMLAGAVASPHSCEWRAGKASRQTGNGKSSFPGMQAKLRYDLLCTSALCTKNAFFGTKPAEDVLSLLQEGRFQAEPLQSHCRTTELMSQCAFLQQGLCLWVPSSEITRPSF